MSPICKRIDRKPKHYVTVKLGPKTNVGVRGCVLLAVLQLLAQLVHAQFSMPSPWTYQCSKVEFSRDSVCKKVLESPSLTGVSSLAKCLLTCGTYGSLWPMPAHATFGTDTEYFVPSNIFKQCHGNLYNCRLLYKAFELFLTNIERYHPLYGSKGSYSWSVATKLKVNVTVTVTESSITRPKLDASEESYSLHIATTKGTSNADIQARTFRGARHALETLSQLINYEEEKNALQIITSVDIKDKPAFPYRGLLLDTSRNFISVDTIKRTIDGMAANKLNTFHWHITDSHSFPMVIKSLPNMAYFGAYSADKLYTPQDIKDIVEYATVRGVRVLPELDAPAHVGAGWEWGTSRNLGDLVVCVGQEPWQMYCVEPPCGQLNIANQNIYAVLGKIYQEIVEMFGPIDLFHYGGDEVNLNCWNTSAEIAQYMEEKAKGRSEDAFYNEWSLFQHRVEAIATAANGGAKVPGIVWTSHLTEKGRVDRYLNNTDYIIQVWTASDDSLIKELLDQKYQLIFSNFDAWYLDCGFGSWVDEGNNWCAPYKGWQKVYDNSPLKIAQNVTNGKADYSLVLGGEATLWTEQVDDASVDFKVTNICFWTNGVWSSSAYQNRFCQLWPRAAALAERLWTDPPDTWRGAEYRMIRHRQRLLLRGLQPERLQPEWCLQNQGLCHYLSDEQLAAVRTEL